MGWQNFGKAKCRFQHSCHTDSSLWATAELEEGSGSRDPENGSDLMNVTDRASGGGDSHILLPLELMSDRDQLFPGQEHSEIAISQGYFCSEDRTHLLALAHPCCPLWSTASAARCARASSCIPAPSPAALQDGPAAEQVQIIQAWLFTTP